MLPREALQTRPWARCPPFWYLAKRGAFCGCLALAFGLFDSHCQIHEREAQSVRDDSDRAPLRLLRLAHLKTPDGCGRYTRVVAHVFLGAPGLPSLSDFSEDLAKRLVGVVSPLRHWENIAGVHRRNKASKHQ